MLFEHLGGSVTVKDPAGPVVQGKGNGFENRGGPRQAGTLWEMLTQQWSGPPKGGRIN